VPCPLGWGEARRKPGPGGGFLGQRYDPLCTECTAYTDRPMKKSDDMQVVRGEPIFKDLDLPGDMTLDRLADRRTLLQQFDDQVRRSEARPAPQGYTGKQQLAFHLLTSAAVREAFDLNREPDRLRELYGRTLFGSSTLLARRLLERGVRFVNVSWDNFRERFEFPPSNQLSDPADPPRPGHPRPQLPHPETKPPAPPGPDLFRPHGRPRPARAPGRDPRRDDGRDGPDAEDQQGRRARPLDVLLQRAPGRGGRPR